MWYPALVEARDGNSEGGPYGEGVSGLTDYRHDPRVVGKMAGHAVLPWIHRVFALMKRWGLGTSRPAPQACRYISDEFVFRYNRRFYRHASLKNCSA